MVIRIVVIAVVAVLVLILVAAASRPDVFRVQRTIDINATSEKIFPFINDFHRWSVWSPYEKLDPGMQKTFGGAASGTGAIYEWAGSGKVGAGRMEIFASSPSSKIAIKLDFIKPFEGHNTAEFTLQAKGGVTALTWAMYGPSPFLSKVMGLFFNMDRLIGKDFETGLANLKALAEK